MGKDVAPILKQGIINNSDTRVLPDQSKFQNRFDAIQSLHGLSDKQKAEILSIISAFTSLPAKIKIIRSS